MSNNDNSNLFLQHLIILVRDRINELTPMSRTLNDFENGKSLAYYEIGGFIEECSRIFNLPIEKLGVTNFSREKLL